MWKDTNVSDDTDGCGRNDAIYTTQRKESEDRNFNPDNRENLNSR